MNSVQCYLEQSLLDAKDAKQTCLHVWLGPIIVPELIPVLGSQPAGDVSHKPGGRLPLLFAMPLVTPTTLKKAATTFAAWWTEAQWVWTVCLRLLPNSVAAAIWTRVLPGPARYHSATEPPWRAYCHIIGQMKWLWLLWRSWSGCSGDARRYITLCSEVTSSQPAYCCESAAVSTVAAPTRYEAFSRPHRMRNRVTSTPGTPGNPETSWNLVDARGKSQGLFVWLVA